MNKNKDEKAIEIKSNRNKRERTRNEKECKKNERK
jgi:hypothetical protein